MPRLLTVCAAAVSLLTACTNATGDQAPAPTTDRSAAIQELRSIDICALYGDADLVAGRPIKLTGFSSPLGCDATVSDPAGDITTTIGLNVGPPVPAEEEKWVRHRVIDGVDVSVASALDIDAPPLEEVVSWTCNFNANYPNNTKLMVIVTSPADADGCAIGEDLIRTAMRAFDQRPQWGSGPIPPTPLSGKDACAVAHHLRPAHQIDVVVDESTVASCMFTIDGSPLVDVTFAYRDPATLDVSPDQLMIDGHRVAGDATSGIFDMVVGDAFDNGNGAVVVPLVSVSDFSLDMDRLRLVLDGIADQH